MLGAHGRSRACVEPAGRGADHLPRTLEELEAEVLSRAENQRHPVNVYDPAVIREGLTLLEGKTEDDGTNAWMQVADRYPDRFTGVVAQGPAVDGFHDEVWPVEDTFLLLTRGTAKEAWINPQGIDMGRQPGVWDSARIDAEFIDPWILRRFDQAVR